MEQLPDFLDEDTPLSVWVQYPGPWWGSSDSGPSKEDQLFAATESVKTAEKVAITDSDADGLGSMVILYEAFPEVDWTHIISGHGSNVVPYVDALKTVAKSAPAGIEVYMTDIMPDEDELEYVVNALADISESRTVHVFDHHDWSEEAMMRVDSVVDSLIVDKGDVCATDITFQAVKPQMEENNPDAVERMEEFAEVTRDHDLWIKDDPRSDDLSSYAFWAESEQDYIDVARRRGAEITDDPEVLDLLEAERWEQHERVRSVVQQAIFAEIGEYTVAFAYGDAYRSAVGDWLNKDTELVLTEAPSQDFTPPTVEEKRALPWNDTDAEVDVWDHVESVERYVINTSRTLTETGTCAPEETYSAASSEFDSPPEKIVYRIRVTPEYAEAAAEQYRKKADLAVLLLPYNKVSFRSDGDEFPYCSKIAGLFNGGGHAEAASCKPGVSGAGGMTGYAAHWETYGALTRAVVADKIMDFIDNGLPEYEAEVAQSTAEEITERLITEAIETAEVDGLSELPVDESEITDGCVETTIDALYENRFIRDATASHVQDAVKEGVRDVYVTLINETTPTA